MPDLATYISDAYLNAFAQKNSALSLGFVEGCIALYERAIQVCKIEHPTLQIHAQEQGSIARQIMTYGESVNVITVRMKENSYTIRLLPCSSWTVWGDDPDPMEWLYEVQIPAPNSITRHKYIPATGICHFRTATSHIQPWKGRSPLSRASLTADVTRLIEEDLRLELQVPIGRILILPEGSNRIDPADEKPISDVIQEKIKNLDGGIITVPTVRGGFGLGPTAAPSQDYQLQPVGPMFSESILKARESLAVSIMSAFGIPPEIMMRSSEGTSQREGWRRFLYAGVKPLGAVIRDEITLKTESQCEINYTDLAAADLQGRARAFKQLIEAGMDTKQASIVTAIEEE